MRTSFASSILAFGVFGIAACGGSNNDPGAGNDPGTGTGTLLVEGSVRASPNRSNATASTDFDAELEVRISLNNQTVTTGTVTVTSSSGTLPLTFNSSNNRWRGVAANYDEVYTLDVVSGPDKAEGVRVDGPDIHAFAQPLQGATVDASMPLMIKWDREDAADIAVLKAENIDGIEIADSGSYLLAGGALKTDQTQARTNKVELTRINRVVPSGAVAGSSWSVRIENQVEVVAQAQP